MSSLSLLEVPKRNKSKKSVICAASILWLLLPGCANVSERQIAESSYHSQENPNTYEHTIRVRAREIQSGAVAELYREAHRRAEERCQGYEIVIDKIYEGTEATSTMLGMSGRWIELKVRCPLQARQSPGSSAYLLVDHESNSIEGASFFDTHAESFYSNFLSTYSAVQRVLQNEGDAIYRAEQDRGLIVTGRSRHGPLGFPLYKQYVIAFDQLGPTKTRVVFKLFVHVPRFEEGRLPKSLELIPVERAYAYKVAAAFVESVARQLK